MNEERAYLDPSQATPVSLQNPLEEVGNIDERQYQAHRNSGINREANADVQFCGAVVSGFWRAANPRTSGVRAKLE